MIQMRLPLLLCLFTVVSWPQTPPARGIPLTEWRGTLSEPAFNETFRLASLDFDAGVLAEPRGVELEPGTEPAALPESDAETDAEKDGAVTPVAIDRLCTALASAAQAGGLPIGFFARLIWQESKFAQWAVSPAGARGVAQFMPQTAAWIGLADPFEPVSALAASARFLRMLHEQFGNLGLAAAAYNAGPGRVQNWLAGRGPLPEETRNYVRTITGHTVEKWTAPRALEVAFRLPPRAPCEGLAGLSRDAEPETLAVTLEPAVVRLIETARAEAAARAALAKKRARTLARQMADKKGARARLISAKKRPAATRIVGRKASEPLRVATQ